MSHTLVQLFYDEDMKISYVKKRLKAFDDKIAAKLKINDIIEDDEDPTEEWYLDANDINDPHLPYKLEAKITDTDEYTEEALEKYLTELVLLPSGGLEFMGTEKQHKCNAHGNQVGVSHSNSIFDTRQYEVHFDDEPVK